MAKPPAHRKTPKMVNDLDIIGSRIHGNFSGKKVERTHVPLKRGRITVTAQNTALRFMRDCVEKGEKIYPSALTNVSKIPLTCAKEWLDTFVKTTGHEIRSSTYIFQKEKPRIVRKQKKWYEK